MQHFGLHSQRPIFYKHSNIDDSTTTKMTWISFLFTKFSCHIYREKLIQMAMIDSNTWVHFEALKALAHLLLRRPKSVRHPPLRSILRLCWLTHPTMYPGTNLLGKVPTFSAQSLKSPDTIRCYSVDKTWQFRRCLHHNHVLASFLYRAAGLVTDMC